ncbi:MAG: hypothetical protein KJ597_02935 [Nanoarchaeota archaeon]|nr:hypothetical protein [Nanoarchaeota archaeon]
MTDYVDYGDYGIKNSSLSTLYDSSPGVLSLRETLFRINFCQRRKGAYCSYLKDQLGLNHDEIGLVERSLIGKTSLVSSLSSADKKRLEQILYCYCHHNLQSKADLASGLRELRGLIDPL